MSWMQRAVDYGFGYLDRGISVMEKDPDLDSLRERSDWPALLETARSRRGAAKEYAAKAAVHRPESLSDGEAHPLLVVLHADGGSKDQILEGPWRRIAEDLGMVLFAPSATIPVAGSDLTGMRWFRDIEDYLERPWVYEEPLTELIGAYCEENSVERGQVFLAGEGFGALLAADIVFTAPGLFGGALLLNGPLQPQLAAERVRIAASLGLSVELVLDERVPMPGLEEGISMERMAEEVRRAAVLWGLRDRLEVRVIDGDSRESETAVRRSGLSRLRARLDERR